MVNGDETTPRYTTDHKRNKPNCPRFNNVWPKTAPWGTQVTFFPAPPKQQTQFCCMLEKMSLPRCSRPNYSTHGRTTGESMKAKPHLVPHEGQERISLYWVISPFSLFGITKRCYISPTNSNRVCLFLGSTFSGRPRVHNAWWYTTTVQNSTCETVLTN